MKEKSKRINVHIPPYLHKQIRECVAQRGESISYFIIRAVIEQLQKKDEDNYVKPEDVY